MKRAFPYIWYKGQSFPVIDVELFGSRRSLVIKALVDSGSTYSVFRQDIADYLGVRLKKDRIIYLEGVGGRIKGYLHGTKVTVDGKSFRCKIVFSPELRVSFNLLGRDNFFAPFFITFKERMKMVEIEW